MVICIYAAGNDAKNTYTKEVETLSKKIAKDGHKLIYGGGSGLMKTAAKSFKEEKGEVIGVAPKSMRNAKSVFEDCSSVIITDTIKDKREIIENRADAFVIVPGGIGTFDKFFQCLTSKSQGHNDKPVIVYNANNYYKKLLECIDDCIKKGLIQKDIKNLYTVANNPIDVVNYLACVRMESVL